MEYWNKEEMVHGARRTVHGKTHSGNRPNREFLDLVLCFSLFHYSIIPTFPLKLLAIRIHKRYASSELKKNHDVY
jgi:hypothetical protein